MTKFTTPRPKQTDYSVIQLVARELTERCSYKDPAVILPMIEEALEECLWFGEALASYIEAEFQIKLSPEILGQAETIAEPLMTARLQEWVKRNQIEVACTIGDEVLWPCGVATTERDILLPAIVTGLRTDIAQVLLVPKAAYEMSKGKIFSGFWIDYERLDRGVQNG